MLLLDVDNLILVVVLHAVDLLVVNVLQVLRGVLRVNILRLDLDHVALELLEQAVDSFLVLLLQLQDPRLVVLLHFELLLLEFEEVAALDV